MAELMKAAILTKNETIEMDEVPVPRIGEGDVLVRVKNCGICGSDVSYFFGWMPTGKMPIILGHEFTGEVVEVGAIPASMGLFKPGDRVVVNPVQHCNACYNCASGKTNLCSNLYVPGVNADGVFAEYVISALHRTVQIVRQRKLCCRRVHRAAGLRGVRHEQARDRARPNGRDLRTWSNWHHDDADRARRPAQARLSWSAPATTASRKPASGARTTCSIPRKAIRRTMWAI